MEIQVFYITSQEMLLHILLCYFVERVCF